MKRKLRLVVIPLTLILFVVTPFAALRATDLSVSADDAASISWIEQEAQSTEEVLPTDMPPTTQPTTEPTTEPTSEPTVEPTLEPTTEPTLEPTTEPTAETTLEPTLTATLEPTTEATVEATSELPATEAPTLEPTPTDAEVTPTVDPEITEEPTVAAPQLDVASTCTEAGVSFVISNAGADMVSPSSYTLVLADPQPDTDATPAIEFSLLAGESLTVDAGFGLPQLQIGETVYQLDAPCDQPVPPIISVNAICAFASGVSFTVSNSGGAMETEQAFSISGGDGDPITVTVEGTFILGANEAVTFEGGYGQPTFSSGDILSTVSEPCARPAVVIGSVWYDADADGIRGETETGIAGVTVNLIDTAGLIQTSTTAGDGSYAFEMLPTGGYTVQVDASSLSADYVLTFPLDGGADGAAILNVALGSSYSADFGYTARPTASVEGVVWLETANYGVRDDGELGISGVMVQLVDHSGAVVATAPVDAITGTYLFAEVLAGDYTVRIDQETLFTPNGVTWNSDDELNYETLITLQPEETLSGVDFGFVGTF